MADSSTVSFVVKNKDVKEWLSKQKNKTGSLNVLILKEIHENGMTDLATIHPREPSSQYFDYLNSQVLADLKTKLRKELESEIYEKVEREVRDKLLAEYRQAAQYYNTSQMASLNHESVNTANQSIKNQHIIVQEDKKTSPSINKSDTLKDKIQKTDTEKSLDMDDPLMRTDETEMF